MVVAADRIRGGDVPVEKGRFGGMDSSRCSVVVF